ncbi:MAG: helix-turn-helix domain-containing protein [Stellaceae bacterium]
MRDQFDSEAFYAALDAHRLAKQLTWKQVAEESGVAASTLTRMAQGKRSDVDGLAALLRWSGLKAESFILGSTDAEPETLAQMTALLRADPTLSTQAKRTLENILHATYNGLKKDQP